MPRFLRRRRRAIASMVGSLFAIFLAVCCETRGVVASTDMACCASMPEGCGSTKPADHECCRTDAPNADQQSGAAPYQVPAKPAATVIALLSMPAPPVLPLGDSAEHFASDGSPPTVRGTPAFLLLSTIRV